MTTDTETLITTEALVDWLRTQEWSEFATSLADFYGKKGYLTEKQEASARKMKATCDAKAAAKAEKKGTGIFGHLTAEAAAKLNAVGQGYYAVPDMTEKNDLNFFRVDRPTEGKWAGRIFVKRVIGGHPDYNVGFKNIVGVLERIAAFGIENSAKTYGVEIGRCYVCNRTLTDELSRTLGIGPVCRGGTGGTDADTEALTVEEVTAAW